VDSRRLALLLALSRLGSMRKVAETFSLTTSTVSQQISQFFWMMIDCPRSRDTCPVRDRARGLCRDRGERAAPVGQRRNRVPRAMTDTTTSRSCWPRGRPSV
jgi:hypothetical protein